MNKKQLREFSKSQPPARPSAWLSSVMSGSVTVAEARRVVTPRDIPLDHVVRLPTAARLRVGMRTVCDVCREAITDEFFYGGFSEGHKNLLLHERCTPEAMRTAPLPSATNEDAVARDAE